LRFYPFIRFNFVPLLYLNETEGVFVPRFVFFAPNVAQRGTLWHNMAHRGTTLNDMSSTILATRICQHCGGEFIARTTVTKYCSSQCNSRAYKAKIRGDKVQRSNNETQQKISIPIEQLKAKEFLNVRDVCNLIGISKRTIYRLIEQKQLKVIKVNTRTIVRRSELDRLLEQPYTPPPKKEPQPVTEFYTVQEIEQTYSIKYGRLNAIIKENKIPTTLHNGKLHVSKQHIDRYFKHARTNAPDITEWYTIQEIQEKYGLTRDQVYWRVADNHLPKQKAGKYVRISKQHFDELFEIGV
jgi:excisionase family DNA binding protein